MCGFTILYCSMTKTLLKSHQFMKKSQLIISFLLVTTIIFDSCYQDKFVFPSASSQIEGTYQADSYYSKLGVSGFYPIQGQTMTLKLTSVGNDSVKVDIDASPNGDYSPGDKRTFERVIINQVVEAQLSGKKQVNCIGYSVSLPINQNNTMTNEILRQRCRDGSAIYYYFISPISKIEATVRFVRK